MVDEHDLGSCAVEGVGVRVPPSPPRVSIGRTPAEWTPQMTCIDEIAEQFVPKPDITYTAAVLNERGFEQAE